MTDEEYIKCVYAKKQLEELLPFLIETRDKIAATINPDLQTRQVEALERIAKALETVEITEEKVS